MLHYAVKADQLAVYVIDDLDLRRWPHEVQRGTACEHLDVLTLVLRETRDDVVCQPTRAAGPWNDGIRHMWNPFLSTLKFGPPTCRCRALIHWCIQWKGGRERCANIAPGRPVFLAREHGHEKVDTAGRGEMRARPQSRSPTTNLPVVVVLPEPICQDKRPNRRLTGVRSHDWIQF